MLLFMFSSSFIVFYYYLLLNVCLDIFFFFKQKTAYEMRISDWSSDVCSSDLEQGRTREAQSEFDRESEQSADREHPEARHRLVRDDAVVDVHREQRQREAEQVDHQRRPEHGVEGTAHPPHFAPEPVALRRLVPRPFLGADRGRVGGDRDRLSGIAFLDRGPVRPERRGGARFPDEILFVLRLEQHRAIAVGAANDRGQLARQVPDLARMKPLVVDQAQVERGLGLMKGEEAPFIARERRQRPALKILSEMIDRKSTRLNSSKYSAPRMPTYA